MHHSPPLREPMRSDRARISRHLLPLLLVAALGVTEAAPMAAGMKIGIDFGPTLTAQWNNITELNQTIATGSVINLSGIAIDGVSIATSNGQFINNDGTDNWIGLSTRGGSAPPEFVDSVTTDIAGNSSLTPDDTPYRVTLNGLNPSFSYRIDAVTTAGGSPIDTLKITGETTYGPSAIARTNAQSQGMYHSFAAVRPNASGTLIIDVTDSSTGKNPIINGILLTATIPGNPDGDEDGLPDAWEQATFGTLTQTAAGDYDGDGDTNLTEFTNGTNATEVSSHSPALQTWQIDFQGGTGGALGSANPITATIDIGYGSKWNAFQIAATNADVFANPPTNHNAAIDPSLENLNDATNASTAVDLSIQGGVSAFNVGRILNLGGINHAFGDHWFWGAQGRTSATVGFRYSHLPPGTYSLTAYANPDQHNPPRDFVLVVGSTNHPIRPVFSSGFYADAGTFAGTARNIIVDGSGILSGSLLTIGGDPSIAAMVLRRISAPSSAFSSNDTAEVNRGGKVRVPVLANDVTFPPLTQVEIVSAPASGTVSLQADGAILYSHSGNTATTDHFSYRFTDASGTSAPATISVSIIDGRIAPSGVTLPLTPPQTSYTLEDAFKDRGAFNFGTPTWMAAIPGNTKRFFVSERTGVIWEIPDMGASAPTRRIFADLSGSLDLFTEMGVKSFAFHPEFESGKPYVYVTYNYESAPSSSVGTVRLSRFTVQNNGTGIVDPTSELIFFEVDSRSQDHNLDSCRFGPDGYLYIGSGDERRPNENAQTITNMFWSSVIRIDVDRRPANLEPNASTNPLLTIPTNNGHANYKIPANNPYAATSGSVTYNGIGHPWHTVRSEIYITGVRNPWQFSFDTDDGEPVLWLGDIGSDGAASREEVNIFRKGDNGGWDHVEGSRYNRTPPTGTVIQSPEYSYARGSGMYEGASVTGGFVYHGTRYPDLDGKYLFGDWLNGHVWTLKRGSAPGSPNVQRITGLSGIVGFATDPSNGDILALSWNSQAGALFDQSGQIGKVFRLKSQMIAGSPFPATLSETGLFADLTQLTPNPGLHFYEPNVTFWSDNAVKRRWFAVPGTQEKITWKEEGSFTFPTGTLWVKHFDMELVRGNPATRKRLETRVIVKNTDGVYGISYRWNDEGTEATLVGDPGATFNLTITDPTLPAGQQTFTQPWQIPSRTQCMTCHNSSTSGVLGFDSRQLNRDDIPFEGQLGNFLQQMAIAGYLENLPSNPQSLPRHVAAQDGNADLESRVRSYLAVNCSYCHADSNGGLDLRAHIPLEETRLLHHPDQGQISLIDPDLRRIVPGSTEHSSVLQRVAGTPGFNRMPPLASSVIDKTGVELLTHWILFSANSAPRFEVADQSVYVVPVEAQSGTVIADLKAIDPDAPRDQVRHTILSGNSQGLFTIDPVSGRLTITDSLSRVEATGLIELIITATDDFAANPKSSSITILIDPTGINDAPRFTGPQKFHVPASLTTGARVGIITVSDPERTPITLTVTGGNANGLFQLDSTTGAITRGSGTITAGQLYTFEVKATDSNVPPASTSRTVTIQTVNTESAGEVPGSGRTFWNVDFQGDGSSTAAGQTTAPATSTLGGMTWNAFPVKAYSGNPSAMSTNPARNLLTHTGATSPVRLHLFTDNNDSTEAGAGVYGYSGRAGLDSLVGDYLLLLDQGGANGALHHVWEITGLTPGWQYDLLMQGGYDGSTARGIAFTVDLDGDGILTDETPSYLQANANATVNSIVIRSVRADANGRIYGKSSRTPPPGQTWIESNWAGMQIRSSQDSPPAFTSSGPFSIAENRAAGANVGVIQALDPEGTTVIYQITSGNDAGRFALDSATGLITTTSPLDYEQASIHHLEIAAVDATGASSITTVLIRTENIIDSNEDRITAWLQSPGSAFEGSNDPSLLGFLADPDHDGIPNAFEYLFGTNPKLPDATPRQLTWTSGATPDTALHLDVDVSTTSASVLLWNAEVSDNCVLWQTISTPPEVVSEQGGRRILRFTAPESTPAPAKRFLRLRMNAKDQK